MMSASKMKERIRELTGWETDGPIRIVTDTTEWMDIHRGDVLHLSDRHFLVKGNARETRFGIKDQPKYWVFNTLELESGSPKIVKTVFHEEFHVRIGFLRIRCYRSPKKEARVLELVRNDPRFMQGYTVLDEKGNHVRIVDFIRGPTILNHIAAIDKPHERYFHEDLPDILRNLLVSIEAAAFLNEHGTCHGDIRNDHIIVEAGTGRYRWIDFDLTQDVSDFDLWSIGNVLCYAVAKGILAFHQVLKDQAFPEAVRRNLSADDGSAFYEYRIMNLKKLYPYIPDSLSHILLHFTRKPRSYYADMSMLLSDYRRMLDKDFPSP